ncbi:CBS domain-containing protein [Plasticicumulans acidivorans]|uniref:CBS domain protein n=1 Tax=Plasticicumulans acidivorans TaxID=886464 RepID=A0A317MTV9_9GAMM|nr:CBS domain-containing protein [Plasticicumulans acidivorans]PWV60546.1 CBS domain protein [Plasticicumulans acidivorans]
MRHRPIRTVVENQKILTASADISVAEAARRMREHHVGAVMIVDEAGRLTGIFTERDALFRVLAVGLSPETLLTEVMTSHPQTITGERPFGHALHLMYESGFRHVPVVDAAERPIGMVSARDALGPEISTFEVEVHMREHLNEVL